jgi:V/A-type H+/Na+-transporting ATPase subunit K
MKIKRKATIFAMLFVALIIFSAGMALAANGNESTAGNTASSTGMISEEENNQNKTYIILGCALAIGIAGISSAIGLALAGSSAVAVTAEKPDMFSKCLILQVLPMTQSVYGLLTAILLMMGAGLLGGTAIVSTLQGIGAIWIGLAVGLTGISAINQGMVASSSISAVGRNPDVASKGIIFTVMPETIAIFGLLVGILLMVGLKLL